MGFFDFLRDNENYSRADVFRMNCRYGYIVEPFLGDLKGAKVLDIASHDGRWSYALAGSGAASVLGVEARAELVGRYEMFPDAPFKANARFVVNDLFLELDALIARGESFDVIAVYGILYHVMDHFRLMTQIVRLQPKLVIIDSEFITAQNAMIQLVREKTDKHLNAAPQIPGQETALIGIPSMGAMERIAEVLGQENQWLDWDALPEKDRKGVHDYYRDTPKRRRTCVWRPAA